MPQLAVAQAFCKDVIGNYMTKQGMVYQGTMYYALHPILVEKMWYPGTKFLEIQSNFLNILDTKGTDPCDCSH